MYYNSFPLNEVFQNLGYAIGQKLQRKAMNTMFEQLADRIEAPYQIAQAALPGTQTEMEALNFGPQPTEGPLVNQQTPEASFIAAPPGNVLEQKANRYEQTPPGYDKFLNPGILAGILRDPKINPETKLQTVQMLGEFRKMMQPQQGKLGRLVPSGSGTYQTIDEYGNVVDTGITVPEKEKNEPTIKMNKWNDRLNAFQVVSVPESHIEAMKGQGWEQGDLKFRPKEGEGANGEDKTDIQTNRRIETYSKAINITLKRYGGSGGITIDLGAAARGEEIMGDQDKSAYAALRRAAEQGDARAIKDLKQVDFWYSKINELAGVAPTQGMPAPAPTPKPTGGRSPAVTKFLEKYR